MAMTLASSHQKETIDLRPYKDLISLIRNLNRESFAIAELPSLYSRKKQSFLIIPYL
jgi:hypothetical protein